MDKNTSIDDILREEEARRISAKRGEEAVKQSVDAVQTPDALRDAQEKRSEKVKSFTLNMDVEDIPDAPIPVRDEQPDAETEVESDQKDHTPAESSKKTDSQTAGCLKKVLYLLIILILSLVIAFGVITYLADALGIGKSDTPIDVEVPPGSSTQQIADMLAQKEVIDSTLYFRVYSKLSGADGKYQLGTFTLTADMGYSEIVRVLQTTTPREEVRVTIPEGYTVEEIAKVLQEKEVCTEEEFYNAILFGEYDYDFIKAIPNDEAHQGRIYRLEGYLFPDTYNFYVGSSGKAVVEKMLDNFNTKINKDIRDKMSAANLTIDETIILASLIQGEAAKPQDMQGVSRVLFNRLDPKSGYSRLELCSTRDYVNGILPSVSGVEVTGIAYNTYVREGLPVGAINNPGMTAIEAVFNPSNDPAILKCYFFATDYDTGITYFNETFAKHEYTCRKYGIGAYG